MSDSDFQLFYRGHEVPIVVLGDLLHSNLALAGATLLIDHQIETLKKKTQGILDLSYELAQKEDEKEEEEDNWPAEFWEINNPSGELITLTDRTPEPPRDQDIILVNHGKEGRTDFIYRYLTRGAGSDLWSWEHSPEVDRDWGGHFDWVSVAREGWQVSLYLEGDLYLHPVTDADWNYYQERGHQFDLHRLVSEPPEYIEALRVHDKLESGITLFPYLVRADVGWVWSDHPDRVPQYTPRFSWFEVTRSSWRVSVEEA